MNRRDTLGLCPECDATLPRSRLLVEYEREGRPATFAECPDCASVVSPEPVDVPSVGPGGDAVGLPDVEGDSELDRRIVAIADVLGTHTDTMAVGSEVFVDRPITVEEKEALVRRIAPQRLKNDVERGEARIEL